MNWGNAKAVETLTLLTQKFQGLGDANAMALKQFNAIVHRQALVMAFSDAFLVLTGFYVALVFLIFVVDKPKTPAGAGESH